MVSTHFARPYRPPGRDLRIMELYGDVAGEAIARRLGVPAADGLGDPVGQAVITALLDPGDGQPPDPALLAGPGGREGRLARQPTSLEEVMPEFAAEVVNRLFSVGLSLESAHSIVGEGPAGDRVAAATGEIDRMIRDIRTIMFSLAADARNHSPQLWPLPPGGHTGRTAELLDSVSDSIFEVGVTLQAAADQPGATGPHITEALRRLEDAARAIRDHLFAERAEPGLAWRPAQGSQQRLAPTADRAALLRERMAQTARALQVTAAGAVAMLEQQARRTRQPQRMDYPTEIKRWRAFAEQAEQMAQRWEQ